jgi:hypothetical protein
MKKSKSIWLTLTTLAAFACIGYLAFNLFGLWFFTKPKVPTDEIAVPPDSLVFRCEGRTETMYLIFKANYTYSLIVRMHMVTLEFEHGTWTQDESGEMTLKSQVATNTISHVTAVRYRSRVTLISQDHTFIKIYAASLADVQKQFDQETCWGLFVQVNAQQAVFEAKTPQPFIFFPELNTPRTHALHLQEGSPLAPDKIDRDKK